MTACRRWMWQVVAPQHTPQQTQHTCKFAQQQHTATHTVCGTHMHTHALAHASTRTRTRTRACAVAPPTLSGRVAVCYIVCMGLRLTSTLTLNPAYLQKSAVLAHHISSSVSCHAAEAGIDVYQRHIW